MINLQYESLILCYTFNAVFLVVADESMGRNVPFVFLERLKDEFIQLYGGSVNAHADDSDDDLFDDRFSIAYNLDREFGCVGFVLY